MLEHVQVVIYPQIMGAHSEIDPELTEINYIEITDKSILDLFHIKIWIQITIKH